MKKHNVLFILADDLGWGDVSYHGSDIKTPNIDRLCKQAIELDAHYVCPVCTPTRACLLTGSYSSRFGDHATVPTNLPVLKDNHLTMADMFKECGYNTALFGKWHLGSFSEFYPGNYGFDKSYGSMAGGVDPYNHKYKKGKLEDTWHEDGKKIQQEGHVTDLITDKAIDWIKTQNDAPWFCYVPYTAVHTPIKPPQEFLDTYQYEKFDDDANKDLAYKKYAAYTSHMDYNVGRLVEALMEREQFEDTIIVFTSDNGSALNSLEEALQYPGYQMPAYRLGSNFPFRGHKAEVYEGGIRTPAFMCCISRIKPKKITKPMHIVDWMPTFAQMLEYENEEYCWDGVSQYDVLFNGENNEQDRVIYHKIVQKNRSASSVRYGDFKLIKLTNNDNIEYELYNIKEDPYESIDLANSGSGKVAEYINMLEEQQNMDGIYQRDDIQKYKIKLGEVYI